LLDSRFGKDQGAQRERLKLSERIAQSSIPKHKQVVNEEVILQNADEIKAARELRKAEKKAAKRADHLLTHPDRLKQKRIPNDQAYRSQ